MVSKTVAWTSLATELSFPALVLVQALPVQCHYSAATDVGRGSLKTIGNRVLDNMCVTWIKEVTLSYSVADPRGGGG